MGRRAVPKPLVLAGLEDAMAPSSKPVSPAAKALTLRPSRSRARARCSVAPAPKPWECAVLGVDTAQNSGWSLFLRGKHQDSGELDVNNAAALALIMSHAVYQARLAQLPIVLVLEFWWGGRLRTCAGLHARCALWRAAWKAAGQAADRAITVQPRQWRSVVLGSWAVSGKPDKKLVRDAELSRARELAGRDTGPDESPAVLIAQWGSHARSVGEAMGKRATKASVQAWQRGGA